MNFLQLLSLRTKLILLSLIPLIGLLFYLQLSVRQDMNSKRTAGEVLRDAEQVAHMSEVLHQFQLERSLSLSFLSGRIAETRQELRRQYESTDQAIVSMEKVLKQQGRSFSGYGVIDSLKLVRMHVNALRSESEIDPFYRNVKTVLLEGISENMRSSQNLRLKNHLEDHLFLLYAKDFLASMRSELAAVLVKKAFTDNAYGLFASAKGKHDINLAKFRRVVSGDLKSFFEKEYQGPLIQQTYAIIDAAFFDPAFANFPYTYDTWWNTATGAVNSLKKVEDFSNDVIQRAASEEMAQADQRVVRNIIIAILIVVLISAVVFYTLKGVISDIGSIKDAADKLAKGDVGVSLNIKSRDEIGALARSFNEMITATRDFSGVANIIGKGDYSPVVEIRSAADSLGIALKDMKNNLQKLARENEIRTWLLTGNGKVNDCMRGEKDVRTLAQDVIIQLVNHLNAQIGAVYLQENGFLELAGSYAFTHRKQNANRFEPGQGLIGQAALEKKPIVFNGVPRDYIRINSGLGEVVPTSIVVFPFLFDGEVKGVVEIGSAESFTDLQLEFLQMVGENIAIAFNAAQSRTKLKELLEETQRQAEELEAQQEELKQSNEELQEKTKLLEKSEGELKAQQEELQQSNEELEEKANLLEEQKEKLEHAKMEIENKARDLEVTSKYKSEFLANMSHELRTPLNSILILSQMLSENKNNVLGGKEVEFCRNIHNSGVDLLHLINEILDLAKVESGRMELDIEEFGFTEIRSAMESMFGEIAKNRLVNFRIEVEEPLLEKTLVTDKQRLGQILRNLLSNAFKFTPDNGSVILKMEYVAADSNLASTRHADPEAVVFTVKDTGIGIAADKLGIIFEAFQQADGSTKRKYGGTGLGLSISRELAHVLGGEIYVDSKEGQGSTFRLHMPLRFEGSKMTASERKVEFKDKQNEPRALGRRTKRAEVIEKLPITEGDISDDRYHILENDKVMLIMEDDPEFARVLLDFVRERNYKGIVAQAGNTGLSYARFYKPDAIILDMKLPVMDGAEVLRHLKNDPALRHIPVQIISGYDHRKESLELGAFDFISKPISKEDLKNAFDKIEEFMRKKLKRLLIIEDDVNQSKAIRELIGNDDVKSVTAFSGNEAYERMLRENYDCVILDLGLPDMPGFELLEKIKRNEQLNKVPIIVYTGRDMSKEEHARLVKFANTVVLKTVDSHERLLDETMLFLHRVEANLPKDKQNIIRKLHKTDEVLKNRKVLVVDDDIRNIYSLTNVLEDQGVECLTAENGKVALRVLKENPDIEMVLMDVMMPEMDGCEATKAIRSIDKFSKLPVIALTAKAMKGDREKCLAAGMSDYIAKPLNIEQLLSLMRIWLYK